MYPAAFEYPSAEFEAMLGEAIAFLRQYGEDAKLLAGGQSLVPMMKLPSRPAEISDRHPSHF